MLASWRRLGYVKLSGLLALSLVVSFAFGVVLVRAGLGTDPDAQTPQAPPELALLEHKLPAAGSAGVPAEPIPPGAPAVEENRPVLGDSAWVLVDWGATNGPEGFEGVLPEWFVSSYRVGGEFVESAVGHGDHLPSVAGMPKCESSPGFHREYSAT